MHIIYTKKYKQSFKKLKKYINESNNLKDIIEFIKLSDNIEQIKHNPIFQIYDFERLKHFKDNEIYSFNLNKSKGVIRLIIEHINNKIYLLYISYDHYKDFYRLEVINYDE